MSNQSQEYKMCTRGVWDTTVPGIAFDENGISNYAKMFDKLCEVYTRGEKGEKYWEDVVAQIKEKGKNKKYDCIIGVSGGTDSSYLLHIAKKDYGLRPLAVNLDNGWNSDISVRNIKKMTNALNIDLETYVIDYEEIKDLLRCYIYAGLPWIDIPTDLAIKAVLYKLAAREGISYVLRGNDFRSEGFQPREWTYGDGRQLNYLHKKFGKIKLKTFPNYTLNKLIYYGYIKGIKSIYPFYFLEYNKREAQLVLKDLYSWEYYGGHHHENVFTKFAISYWLFEKFNIDKRIITLSAQILSGQISRNEAIEKLEFKSYDTSTIDKELEYVLKKLDLSKSEFNIYFNAQNRLYSDYPSYYPLISKFSKISKPVLKIILPYKPMALFQMEMRSKK